MPDWRLLTREDLTKRVADLSIGQQRKVELGILVGSEPDVLLLDEPTNHLTFDVIESLQAALIDFDGPVLIATHDRRLIREFPRRLWRLHEGRLAEVEHSGSKIGHEPVGENHLQSNGTVHRAGHVLLRAGPGVLP